MPGEDVADEAAGLDDPVPGIIVLLAVGESVTNVSDKDAGLDIPVLDISVPLAVGDKVAKLPDENTVEFAVGDKVANGFDENAVGSIDMDTFIENAGSSMMSHISSSNGKGAREQVGPSFVG
ncbi:hypothetical protein E8E13_008695 [Curvularia kusanoi]|uniref:Uncharacterized protein n=1 Tax=Curvularia kusanoi TaxID=90978 RepID=A0A9P4W537_CURKU|nr:hypothetical protein E8E13_008695 [Curvularia kusanoi]